MHHAGELYLEMLIIQTQAVINDPNLAPFGLSLLHFLFASSKVSGWLNNL